MGPFLIRNMPLYTVCEVHAIVVYLSLREEFRDDGGQELAWTRTHMQTHTQIDANGAMKVGETEGSMPSLHCLTDGETIIINIKYWSPACYTH